MSDDEENQARTLLAPEPTAASQARSFIRETLSNWDTSLSQSATDDAVLLASELVANAVQHAGTDLEIGLRLTDGVLEVAVTDRHPSRTLPEEPQAPAEEKYSERGRGLTLPIALASAWGVTYTASAKTVWFRLRADGASASGAAIGEADDAQIMPVEPPAPATGDADAPAAHAPPDLAESRADGPGSPQLGKLHFDELVRHTVEAARDAVGADAAYALVADEEGDLRVRGAVGVEVPDALTAPPATMLLSGGGVARSQMSVPFLVDGRVTGVLGVGSGSPGRFRDTDEQRLQGVADRAAMSLERLRLSELERVRRGRVAFLAEASELLSSTLDQQQAIALTAQLMVPRLAAWCAVLITDDVGELKPAYVWHEDEAKIDALGRLLDEIAPPVLTASGSGTPGVGVPGSAGVVGLSTGQTGPGGLDGGNPRGGHSWSLAVPPGAGMEDVQMASDSAWCFPLTARGRGLGAVVIGRPREDRRWQDPPPRESMELAEDLARRAALALDNARLYERQRMTSQALQHSLLPPELPEIPRAELAAEYQAAGEANDVGGDFYDVFAVGEGRWRFAIGDVSGTGPEAAAVTGLARHTLRILAAEGHPITEVVGRLNGLINRENARGRFITLLHGEITVPPAGPASGPLEASLVCAGHPLPLLLRASDPDGAPAVPAAEPQMLLGVAEDVSFEAQKTELFPGDLLLCVTDGVTERRDETGRLLDDDDGLAKLLGGCRDLSAWAVASRLRRAVGDFGAEPSSDDMAILVMRAAGAAARGDDSADSPADEEPGDE
ncbi:MAG: SpoIIE family protein phosphatase [Streptosporangiales bacterium]|nr:SpoIIE family protein phosphatase [Streptosporangiales bacterium]